ncbi:MAG: hypothetical protein M3458_15875 [Acidobacteriota bacterium]|nr:hypothetical protein [Acidobacteriota bacterium]
MIPHCNQFSTNVEPRDEFGAGASLVSRRKAERVTKAGGFAALTRISPGISGAHSTLS